MSPIGFDAGSIRGHIELDTEAASDAIDEIKAKGDELADKTFTPSIDADTTDFEAKAEEVEGKKDELEKPVEVPIDASTEDFDAKAAEVELEKELLKRAVDIRVNLSGGSLPSELATALKDVDQLGSGGLAEAIGKGGRGSGYDLGQTVENLLNGGTASEDMPEILKAIGWSQQDIADALSAAFPVGQLGAASATDMARGVLPSASEFQSALEQGFYSLTAGDVIDQAWRSYEQDWSSALDSAANGGGFSAADLRATGFWNTASTPQLTAGITAAADADAKTYEDALKDYDFLPGISGEGGGRGNILSSVFGTPAAAAKSWGQGLSTVDFAGILSPILLPVAAALGGALDASLAGTVIGGIGTIGFGIGAAQAISQIESAYAVPGQVASGQMTQAQGNSVLAGLNPQAVSAARQLTPFLHELQTLMRQGEAPIFGIIENFFKAASVAAPLLGPYMQAVDKAMSGFFGAIDNGLASGGFATFMNSFLTPETGQVMQQFGTVIINLGKAFGTWLVVMKPLIDIVGPGWVSLSGDFAKFTAGIHITPQFLQSVKDLGNDFSSAFGLVEQVIKTLNQTHLAMDIFNQIPVIAGFLKTLLKDMPPGLATTVTAVAIALALFTKFPTFTVVVLGLEALDRIMAALGIHMTPAVATGITLTAGALLTLSKIGAFDAMATSLGLIVKNVLGLAADESVIKGIGAAIGEAGTAALGPWALLVGAFVYIQTHMAQLKAMANQPSTKANPNPAGPNFNLFGDLAAGFHSIFKASGGPVAAGSQYVVGEQGPELFVPQVSGTIVPNGQFGRGSQTITIQIDARQAVNPAAITSAVHTGIASALPALQAALARGSAA